MNKEVSYLSDERDSLFRSRLKMFKGENGDFYQLVESNGPKGQITRSHAVRFSMSGGASTRNPDMMRAIVDQYKSMNGEETSYQEILQQRDKANEMLQKVLDKEVTREDLEIFIMENRL